LVLTKCVPSVGNGLLLLITAYRQMLNNRKYFITIRINYNTGLLIRLFTYQKTDFYVIEIHFYVIEIRSTICIKVPMKNNFLLSFNLKIHNQSPITNHCVFCVLGDKQKIRNRHK
ncbi:MAG: hypothetical protein LBE18_08235, partial [Planctomycetaceae bacterium]|nr:hypothetical protein [Planctomycetaceae bacterium]